MGMGGVGVGGAMWCKCAYSSMYISVEGRCRSNAMRSKLSSTMIGMVLGA